LSLKYRLAENEALYNCRVKRYGNIDKWTVFSKPILNPYCEPVIRRKRTCFKKSKDNEIREDSIRRARIKIMDIAHANRFEYFVTFTLNQEKVNRYDKDMILKKLHSWLKRRAHDFKYILVPELHEDGAIHFHGFVSGWLKMEDSGRKTKRGQTIYNAGKWDLGFSTAVKLEGPYNRIVNYLLKYITKDNARIFGKSYFAGGKYLKREVPTRYENIGFEEIEGKVYHIPAAGLSVKYMDYDYEKAKVSRETIDLQE
jgi:hypothetical protein